MSALTDQLLELLNIKFNLDLQILTKFWDKPPSLQFLQKFIINSLKEIIGNLIVDRFISSSLNDIKTALKLDETTNKILTSANDLLDEEIISDLLRKCQNISEDTVQDLIKKIEDAEFNSEDSTPDKWVQGFLNALEGLSDLAEKIRAGFGNFLNSATSYASMVLLVYYIIRLLIDTINQADFPSPFRLNYIQKLLRITLSSIWNLPGEQWKELKAFLVTIDGFTVAIGLASGLYLWNVSRTRRMAEISLNEDLCSIAKDEMNKFSSIEIQTTSLENDNDILRTGRLAVCPVIDDGTIVPKEPYESKLDNIDTICNIPVSEEGTNLRANLGKDLAVKAIIENKTKNALINIAPLNSRVTDETVLATLEGHSVYSPTNGYITTLLPNKIELSDISDNTEDFLTRNILSLNEKYKELNDIKFFIKKWQVVSLYPVMMMNSPETDGEWTAEELATKIYDSMYKQFEVIKEEWGIKYEEYEKTVKDITGKDNIKTHGDNETLYIIKEDIDSAEELINAYLKTIKENAISIARVTDPKSEEFILIDYYLFELGTELNVIKEPTDIEKRYRNQINVYIEQRYVLDKAKPNKIEEKITELFKRFESVLTNLFQMGLDKYNENKKFSDLENWINNVATVGTETKNLSLFEKEQISSKILYLYDLYLNISERIKKYDITQLDPSVNKIEEDDKQQVIEEGNYIDNFFGNLWKRYEKIPVEISEIEKTIEDLAIFSPYTLRNDPSTGEQIRIYKLLGDTSLCPPAGGFTEADFGNIRYWLRYCTFATLASVINQISGWATGFPVPPLLLPTIYIPIKPIATQYGFIVIGLTITGVWIFPFILMVNYSTNYAMPLFDPTGPIKKAINEKKAEISNQLKELRGDVLKGYMDKKAVDVKSKEIEINTQTQLINEHKTTRPANTKRNAVKTEQWNKELVELQVPEKSLKLEKFKLEQQHKIVYDAQSAGINTEQTAIADPALTSIQASEKLIDKEFEAFDLLIDQMDNIVAPLPTTLQPNTANFGITLKNPRPVINIADNLNENVNDVVLGEIKEKYKLNNEGFMRGPNLFQRKIDTDDRISYNKALNIAKLLPGALSTIAKDPFPSYENLKLTNFQWQTFLITDFVTAGAKTYGIPGFAPFPV